MNTDWDEPERKDKSDGKERAVKIGIIVIILAVVAYFGFDLLSDWHKSNIETAKNQERKEWQDRTEILAKKVAELEDELTQIKGENVPTEKLAEVFGEKSNEIKEQEKQATQATKIQPQELERQILAFFNYLDQQEYVKAYKLEGGTYHQYTLAVEELSVKIPKSVGEMESLYTMLRNIAHFYRTLGKERVGLTKEVLKNEFEIFESVMRTFYMWYTTNPTYEEKIKGRPNLNILYEYSGYFLNTLGGRSYLMRRTPKIRILLYYYCVLILDRANDQELNSNGIDIRPHIIASFEDIRNHIGLIYQNQYLIKLESLAHKYKI